jgi:flagellar biosynthesis protein FliQ
MTDIHMLTAMQQMLYYVVIGVCIVTLPTLIVGIILSILQAATQINEMTITFIPKLIVMFFVLFTMSPWLMEKLIFIMRHYMTNLPEYIK